MKQGDAEIRFRPLLSLFLLWLASILNCADRQFVFSIFPVLRRDLNFTNAELGLTGALFLWIYGVASPLGGSISDRFPRRQVVTWTLVLWSAATLLSGVASSPVIFLLSRAIVGAAEATFTPAATAIIGAVFPGNQRSRASAFLYSGQLIGLLFGGWYGGYVAQFWNWRWAFYSAGIAGLLYAFPFGRFLPASDPPVRQMPNTAVRLPWWSVWSVPTFRALCLCFPLYSWMLWMMNTWLPDYFFSRYHLPLASAAFAATISLQGGIILGLLSGGLLGDRLYRKTTAARFWLICAAFLISSPFALILGFNHSLPVAEIAVTGFGFGYGIFMANFNISSYDVIEPARYGSAVGFMNLIGTPISGAMPVVAGLVRNSIGIAGLLRYGSAGGIVAGIALALSIRRWFSKDRARAYPKSIAQLDLSPTEPI